MRLMNVNYCTQPGTVVSAANINPNFPVSNAKHPFRSKRVRTATGTTSLAIVFDMATTEAIDSCVLLWPKEDGIRLSNTATIHIQANATNVWTSPAVNQVMTVDDVYMMSSHYFTSDQNYRYWRVYIQDADNAYDFIELGLCWLGKGIAIDNAQNGFKYQLSDSSKTSRTDFGHRYVDEYPTLASIQFEYQMLEYEQIQILENAFRTNGTRDPVMVCLDPDEVIFNKNHFAVYGNFNPEFGLQHYNYDILNTEGISIVELG